MTPSGWATARAALDARTRFSASPRAAGASAGIADQSGSGGVETYR